jgi:hypothetical protein
MSNEVRLGWYSYPEYGLFYAKSLELPDSSDSLKVLGDVFFIDEWKSPFLSSRIGRGWRLPYSLFQNVLKLELLKRQPNRSVFEQRITQLEKESMNWIGTELPAELQERVNELEKEEQAIPVPTYAPIPDPNTFIGKTIVRVEVDENMYRAMLHFDNGDSLQVFLWEMSMPVAIAK